MKRRQVIWGLAVGFLTLWFVGGIDTVWSRAAEVKALSPAAMKAATEGKKTAAIPLVAPASSQPYRQRTIGKADPFKPFIETDREQSVKMLGTKGGGKIRPISPLQQKDIGQFRLVGIVGDDKRRTAVVEDGTAKKIYPLQVGTYIGLNEGRVTEILPDRVIVKERVEDQTKKAKKAQIRRIIITLHKEE